jgi:hypothetical protein
MVAWGVVVFQNIGWKGVGFFFFKKSLINIVLEL